MHDIILHHYDTSPFSEKIRLILGAKGLAWRSVQIPRIMPKPDLVALTGGYRKTPVMQIGADIYCDTALIAAVLDRRAPAPPLLPPAVAAAARAMAAQADTTLFGHAVAVIFQPQVLGLMFRGAEDALKAFVQDRAAMRRNPALRRVPVAEAQAGLTTSLADLSAQLGDGRPYLLGDAPTLADFSTCHPLWFVARAPIVAGVFDAYPLVGQWLGRMAAIGHGMPTTMSSAEAIAVAAASETAPAEPRSDLAELPPGSRVEVAPSDYGIDPVVGELVRCDGDEIAIRRRDPRAGVLMVHFPRQFYDLRAAAS